MLCRCWLYQHGPTDLSPEPFCFVLLLHVIVLVLVLVIVKLTDVWEHGKDGSRVPAAKLAAHGGVEFVTLF